jgi:hypothetical protein
MTHSDLDCEYAGAEFGDARLSQRVVKLAAALSTNPSLSFPKVLSDSELEAAYRFFGHKRVNPGAILEPHVAATLQRIGKGICLAVHDTTSFSYRPDGEREGLSKNHNGNQCFHAHVTLALSADFTPQGVVGLWTHVGKAATAEHQRWGAQALAVEELGFKAGQVLHLMDREADDYELFSTLQQRGSRFVIRLQHNRTLADPADSASAKVRQNLPKHAVALREVPLSARSGRRKGPKAKKIHPVRRSRIAKLAFAARSVVLERPKSAPRKLPATLTVNLVHVWEVETAEGEAPVEWLLYTTEPVDTAEEILQVVDWYRGRWVIEEYFKAVKTGCSMEERQLESRHALENALALFLPIAWQMLRIRNTGREKPDTPASEVLPPEQLEVLRLSARKPLPPNPTARDVMLAIAKLGGHLKRNGDPGWLTLWRGYEEILLLTKGWLLAQKNPQKRRYDQS